MKIFISWSGERSRFVASALRNWLPLILQAIEPWMSQTDLKAGTRWNPELENELAKAVFGVTCVTPENRDAPWLLFEAGALATQVKEEAYLCPYLIELETSDVEYPLAQFQMKKWDAEGTLGLVRGINDALLKKEPKSAISVANLENLFEALWPQLDKQYSSAPNRDSKSVQIEKKDTGELVGETLEQTRDIARQLARLEGKVEAINANTTRLYGGSFPVGIWPSVPGSSGLPGSLGLGLPIRSAPFGEGERDPALVSLVNDRVREFIAEAAKPAKPKCSKCGATDNFRLGEAKEFNPRVKHHDVNCGTCEVVVRQFHTFDRDEQKREWGCPPRCRFHLNPETPTSAPA
jgi:hypothetical protein